MIRKSLLFWIMFSFIFIQKLTAQKTFIIYVSTLGFTPDNITIDIGDTIVWQWVSGIHTTTSDSLAIPEAWDGEVSFTNWTFEKTFNSAGIFTYHCQVHETHRGVITVIDPVPVELTSFKVELADNLVLVVWETATEVNNLGFNIERRMEKGNWAKIAFIKGKGTSSSPQVYIYNDEEHLESGIYYYRIKQIDFNGTYRYYNKAQIEIKNSNSFELLQNYPNPFNPVTSIRYVVPEKSFIQIKIFNVLGNEVATLVNEEKSGGFYETTFDGSQLSSGIYYLQMKANEFQSIKKMILIR